MPLNPDLGQKPPIQKTCHAFLKIKDPQDFKNQYHVYSGEMTQ